MRPVHRVWLLICLCVACASLADGAMPRARASETFAGPVAAQVLRVVDGDTIVVRARIWLGQSLEVFVRIDGIDAPEHRGRCQQEKELARQATILVAEIVAQSDQEVVLRDIRYGKYSRRVVARVTCPRGGDLAGLLLDRGLARPYSGTGRRATWCGS